MSATLTAEQPVRYPPGDLATWIFILAELAVFAILDLLPFPACGARYGDSGGGGAEDAPRRLFRERTGMETGGVYWHMVDLVWLILFPLVYVMR